ncbi:MAG: hypothetical protein FWE25_10555 [Lachnospiraceae bacterium]|nr:hypothetical protein [Lachnospiraceae bacterium]
MKEKQSFCLKGYRWTIVGLVVGLLFLYAGVIIAPFSVLISKTVLVVGYLFAGHFVLIRAVKSVFEDKKFDENVWVTIVSLTVFGFGMHAFALGFILVFRCIMLLREIRLKKRRFMKE